MKMKKIIAVCLVFAMALMCGCAKAPINENLGETKETSPIQIVWWHTMDSQYDELVKNLVDEFNNSQSDIVVLPEYMGSFNDINEALVAANAAGEGLPGVAVCNTKFLTAYASNGIFEDLSPYILADNFSVSDIEPGMYSIGTYGDKQVAMPFFHNTHVIYYNKDMANEYGLNFPSDFSELDAFFDKVKETTGITPLAMQGLDFYYGSFYRNAGVNIVDAGNCDLNCNASVAVTKKIRDWVKDGDITWLIGNDASSNMKQAFYQQSCFAVMHNSTAWAAHQQNAPFEVGIAWYPGVDGSNNADLGGGVIGIPSKNNEEIKAAAWKFISYLCGNESTIKIATETGYLPICTDASNKDMTKEYLTEIPEYKTVYDNMANVVPPFVAEEASEICKIWQQYMNLIMTEDADVEASLQAATDEINEAITDN